MNKTKFYNPTQIDKVLELLDEWGEKAIIVNGGTDIVEKIANGQIDPSAIIYIQNIPELKYIQKKGDYISIGGASTYKEILASLPCKQFSGLIQSIEEIGSPPIRALATVAGNIGTAVPAGDCNISLIALDAQIVLASKAEERIVPAEEIFIGYQKTKIQPNELIKEIRIPLLKANSGSAFMKLTRRKAQDIAQVSAGVVINIEKDLCRNIRIALGAVNSTPVRAFSLEKLMNGKKINEGLQAVKNTLPSEIRLRTPRNKAYKMGVIGTLVERTIKLAYAEYQGGN